MLEAGKRYQVFSIKEKADKTGEKERGVFVKAGAAFVNRDGSLNVYLDVLPLDGRLHIREALEKREDAADGRTATTGSALVEETRTLGAL